MKNHDTSGDLFAPTSPRNLPNRILRSIDNALHLNGLPRSVRATLADICRFVSQARPFDTVFAHKEKIAARTGASERTIYRHLNALQKAGLINVLGQERKSRNGRFSVSRIRLTQLAAGLLGFIEIEENLFITDKVTGSNQSEDLIHTTTRMATNLNQSNQAPASTLEEASNSTNKSVIHSLPSAILSHGQTLSVPTISKNHPRQPTKNGLPIDLAWLTSNGLSRAGIFKLMGLAKSKNKRLSDVLIVVKDYVKEMKGGRLFSYLAVLCQGPTDFSVAAANERKRISDEKDILIFKRKCKIFRERFKNTAFTDQKQSKLYLIDEQANFAQVFGESRHLGTMPLHDLTHWIQCVENGKLVLATLEIEKRFVSRI